MSLDDIVNISITAQTQSVSRAGFGTPLIAAHHTNTVGARVETYSTLEEMVAAGFLVTDPAYLAAAALVAQNPRVTRWKVGRRDLPATQTKKFTPLSTAQGLVYTITVTSQTGVVTVATYTVQPADTIALITAGLQAQLNAIAGITATDNSTDVDVAVDTAGELWSFTSLNAELEILSTNADPGIATDLAAIVAEDDDWYGLLMDTKSEAEINAAAAFIETRRKLFVAQTSDTGCKQAATTTDIMSDLKAAAYGRTAALFHEDDRAFADAAWMGKQFPKTPGSTTWAFKTLAGITVSPLTTAEKTAIEGKFGNHYTLVGGLNITFEGKVAANEYIDTVRFIDALERGMQEDVFAVLASNEKVPFTDTGVGLVVSTVKGRLTQGILDGGLAADPAPVVTAPKVADVPPASKVARTLPDVNFTGVLAGAIHKTVITGVISV